MKIKQLIEKIDMFDPEAEVVIQDPDDTMTLHEIESFGYVPTRIGKTLAINAMYFVNPSDERFRE